MPARPVLILLAGLSLAACAREEVPIDAGRALFVENCAVCHGMGARGDGPLADGMRPRPADLTQIAARNGGIWDMAAVMSRIDGYRQDGGSMPEFGAVLEGPTVMVDTGDGIETPAPQPLFELADFLRRIQEAAPPDAPPAIDAVPLVRTTPGGG
jgi:mono/diheme cytochrome c family protein